MNASDTSKLKRIIEVKEKTKSPAEKGKEK